MPELPEVETVVKTLEGLVLNRKITEVDIYWDNIIAEPSIPIFKEKIRNQSILAITRRGKYILFELNDFILVSHLRMEGKYYVYDSLKPKSKHVHVIFNFDDGGQMHYHDTRKFGKMYLYEREKELTILRDIGLEPWDKKLTVAYLKDKAKNRRISIKQFLLDQSVIAGIGNIYVNEICFAAKVHPATSVNKITEEDWQIILLSTQKILSEAIEQGGTTIRSYTSSLGVTGLFQQQLKVHDQEGEACPICHNPITKIKVANRGTYLCEVCQKEV